MKLKEKISWLMGRMQRQLFPCQEECCVSPLTEQEKYLVKVLEIMRIESHIEFSRRWMGRPPAERKAIARCVVAKVEHGASDYFTTLTKINPSSRSSHILPIFDFEVCRMQNKKQVQRTHGSLEKGIGLLSAFIPDNKEMGTVEIAKQFSMNRSTVSRMLTVLKRQGFVRQNPTNQKYSLGSLVPALAAAYQSSFHTSLTHLASSYLDQLRNDLDLTVVLEIPDGDRTAVTYVTEGHGPLKIAARIGDRHHYHTSAGGKCILAFLSQELISEILKTDLPRLTKKTISDPEVLSKELKAIRKNSFAFDGEGNNKGINAFAVPILERDGSPIAAIVAAGPSNLVIWQNRQIFVERLTETAAAIRSIL